MALTKISTDGFKDDAVTADKLANAINTERTANTAKVSTTINNNADNRVITGSGTANTLNGESKLTFDGNSDLTLDAIVTVDRVINATDSADPWLKGVNSSNTETAWIKPNGGAYLAGNVSIGTSSQNWKFQAFGGRSTFTDTTAYALGIRKNSVQDADHNFWIGGAAADDDTHPDLVFSDNSGSEKFRFKQGGELLIGTTTTGNAHDNGDGIEIGESNGLLIGVVNKQAAVFARHSGQGELLRFQSGNTDVGSIDTSGSGVNYTSGSDYRLKENIVALTDGITRLKTLKPSRFNFKADKDKTVDGFIAHEVTAVPEAVTGTKDEVDADNKPIYQGIDLGKLVPLLTAALQEAVAKIETLETKVAALEAA